MTITEVLQLVIDVGDIFINKVVWFIGSIISYNWWRR